MPKGFHCSHTRIRHYTVEYHKLTAKVLKPLLTKPLGNYQLTASEVSTPFELKQKENGNRYLLFNFQDKTKVINLVLCNQSASNKLYLSCPHCQAKKQHLYQFKSGYACRDCLGLHYASQSESEQDRLARRIRKLRVALWGYESDINNLTESAKYFTKPKYMNWSTFESKRDYIVQLESKYWGLCADQLARIYGEQFK